MDQYWEVRKAERRAVLHVKLDGAFRGVLQVYVVEHFGKDVAKVVTTNDFFPEICCSLPNVSTLAAAVPEALKLVRFCVAERRKQLAHTDQVLDLAEFWDRGLGA